MFCKDVKCESWVFETTDFQYGFCTEMGQKPTSSLTYCLIKPLELNLGKNIS